MTYKATRTYYHGTSRANLESILREGIKPHAKAGADKWAMEHNPNMGAAMQIASIANQWRVQSVFVSTSIRTAAWFAKIAGEGAHDAGAILKITIPATDRTPIFDDEQSKPDADSPDNPMEAYRYCGNIPAAWLKEVTGAPRAKALSAAGPTPSSDPLEGLFG